MVDFAALRDPEVRARLAAEREAEDAAQEAANLQISQALDRAWRCLEDLPQKERSFLRSVRVRVLQYLPLSDPQKKWLFDIASRCPS